MIINQQICGGSGCKAASSLMSLYKPAAQEGPGCLRSAEVQWIRPKLPLSTCPSDCEEDAQFSIYPGAASLAEHRLYQVSTW